MKIFGFTFNAFGENTYVVYDDSNECIIIDPGNSNAEEDARLFNWIEEKGLTPTKIVNTHAHIDHVLGLYAVKTKYPDIEFWLFDQEKVVYDNQKQVGANYGFHNYTPIEIDQSITLAQPITFGNTSLKVLFCPGHSPGHVVFYHEPQNILIAGDVLFQNSIGRTDLPGGNHQQLLDSIREQLFVLPDETVVVCGHGPTTTIGHEKVNNPFVGQNAY